MGLCGVWKDTTGRKEIDTTSDNSQPPIRESQFFFSIVKTVTTKQNARTILLITED